MHNRNIAVFSSCAGYGTYTPALALKKDMASIGSQTEIFVFETFFEDAQKTQFLSYRNQFHNDFRFAKMAAGLASKTIHGTSMSLLPGDYIKSETFHKYVVLYGLWLPVLLELGIDSRQIICLQMDVADSPSWHAVKDLSAECENIWLLGKNGMLPPFKLQDEETGAGKKALVIHGGGWGITNYAEILNKIRNNYELHVIHSSHSECSAGYHSYYTPINWLPDKDNPDYPPLNQYPGNKKVDFSSLCLNSCAIISKPGGGTCVDALRLHRPVVYLQGMAKHEEKNAEHFEKLGYACSFQEWEETGYSFDKLESMRKKIAADMAGIPLISYHLK